MELLSFQITDVLAQFEGTPSNWHNDPSNVSIVGFRDAMGRLDEKKVDAFMQLNYTRARQLLNIERFEYYIEMRDENGNVLNSSGSSPNKNATRSVSTLRISSIGNITRQIGFTLWKR